MRVNEKGKWEYMGGINPRPIEFKVHVAPAPHVKTLRGVYTVPKARYAFLSQVHTHVGFGTNPTTPGIRGVTREFTRLGESMIEIYHVQHSVISSFVSEKGLLILNLPLIGGDRLEFFTIDSSTGGTTNFGAMGSIVEFDK